MLQRTCSSYTTPTLLQLQVSACLEAKSFNSHCRPHRPSTATVLVHSSLVQLLGTGGPKHQHSTWKNCAEEASNPKGAPEKSMSAGNSSLSKPCSNVLYSKVINVSLMQDTSEKICQKQNSEGRRPFPLVFGTRPSKLNV